MDSTPVWPASKTRRSSRKVSKNCRQRPNAPAGRRRFATTMNDLGKYLVFIGLILVIVGASLWSGLGRGWLGRLPGDVHYHKGNFSFYFPIVTCIILGLLLTLGLWFFRK